MEEKEDREMEMWSIPLREPPKEVVGVIDLSKKRGQRNDSTST